MRDKEFHEQNRDLHTRWVRLCEKEPADQREADRLERRKKRLADEVIKTNHRMLWKSVQQFAHTGTTDGTDLYSVAAGQLWRVFQEWDPERATLATAAKSYISGAVRREVAQTEFNGMSYDMFTKRGNLLKVAKQLGSMYGRQPTMEEIAEESGEELERVKLLLTAGETSLDAPVSGGSSDSEATSLGEFLAQDAYEEDDPADDESLTERDTPEMLAGQDPVDVFRYLLGTKASTYRLPRKSVGYLTGDTPRGVHASVAAVTMEVAVRQVLELVGRLPTAAQLAEATGVPEDAAAAFLEEREGTSADSSADDAGSVESVPLDSHEEYEDANAE